MSRSGILKNLVPWSVTLLTLVWKIHQTLNGQIIRSLDDLGTAVMNVVRSSAANEYSKKLQERKIDSWKSKKAKKPLSTV